MKDDVTMRNVTNGYIINITSGYWRAHNHTADIAECVLAPENCLGGTANFTCATGHIGALCEACDLYGQFWNESYASADATHCGSCNEVSGNAYKIAGITIYTMITMGLSVKGTYLKLANVICLIPINNAGYLLFSSH